MKKLLASALLAGLMLGTTTQVFAAEDQKTQTPVTSTFSNEFLITIPPSLTIELVENEAKDGYSFVGETSPITLNKLNSIGQVNITATTENLKRIDAPNPEDQSNILNTQIKTGENSAVPANTPLLFSLSNAEGNKSENITIQTFDKSTDKHVGTYEGNVIFNFEYVAPAE